MYRGVNRIRRTCLGDKWPTVVSFARVPLKIKRAAPGKGRRYSDWVLSALLCATLSAFTCWTTVMNEFWRFLRDKRNQQVLGWLGGGLVVAATGLWAAFVYFFPPVKSPEAKSPEPTPPSVQADCGGIAIGRDVTGSTITAGTTTNSDCGSKPK